MVGIICKFIPYIYRAIFISIKYDKNTFLSYKRLDKNLKTLYVGLFIYNILK